MGRVSFVQTSECGRLFPIFVLTNHLLDSSL